MNRASGPRVLFVMGSVAAVLALGVAPALACGGLVGENGTIELVRTTTLAAYSDGVERYVTAFEYSAVRARRWARSSRSPTCPPRWSEVATGRCNGLLSKWHRWP